MAISSEFARIVTAAQSDIGRTRSENQDAFGEFSTAEGERLLVVADGMGGHRGGATASRLCVETVGRAFSSSEGAPSERLRRALVLANERVYEAAASDPAVAGMGATVVALVLRADGAAELAWIGDSRAYRFRAGSTELLSADHSVVSEMVRTGLISEEEAETHPRRNELLRAVGPSETVEPALRSLELAAGDRFLLCTDGLWGAVSRPEITAVLGFEAPELAVRKLVARANERGGPDNVTALIAWLPEELTAPALPAEVAAPKPSARAANRALPALFASAAAVTAVLILVAAYAWFHSAEPEGAASEPAPAAVVASAEVTPAPLAVPNPGAARVEPKPGARPSVPTAPAALPKKAPARPSAAPAKAKAKQAKAKPAAAPPAAAPPATAPAPASEKSAAEPSDTTAPDPLAETQRFLGSWQDAVERQDFALYKKLGLPGDESYFKTQYVENKAKLAFSVRDVQHNEPDGYLLTVQMVTETQDADGDHRVEEQRRFLLQHTPSGLQYAGESE